MTLFKLVAQSGFTKLSHLSHYYLLLLLPPGAFPERSIWRRRRRRGREKREWWEDSSDDDSRTPRVKREWGLGGKRGHRQRGMMLVLWQREPRSAAADTVTHKKKRDREKPAQTQGSQCSCLSTSGVLYKNIFWDLGPCCTQTYHFINRWKSTNTAPLQTAYFRLFSPVTIYEVLFLWRSDRVLNVKK